MISRELFSIRVQTNLQTMEMDVMKTFNVTMNFAVEPLANITSRSRFSEKLLILLYEQLLIFGLYLENFKSFILLLLLLLFIYSFLYIYIDLFIASLSEKKSLGQYFS